MMQTRGALMKYIHFLPLVVLFSATKSHPCLGADERKPPLGPIGTELGYHRDSLTGLGASDVERFTLSFGPVESDGDADKQWLALRATKVDGARFAVWILARAYPARAADEAAATASRYLLQEGEGAPKEFVHKFTGAPVLPSLGAWEYLWPRAEGEDFSEGPAPQTVHWLGHPFVLEKKLEQREFPAPTDPRRVELLPDVMIGVPSNKRTRDSIRRYDNSDYEMVRLTREDYSEMIRAGMNCFQSNREIAEWLKDEPVFQWGVAGADVAFPECLFRSTYLGAAVHIDEPAVSTRDYVIRPRLAKEPAFRHELTSNIVLDAFKTKFHEAVTKGSPGALMTSLRARKDVDLGEMDLTQRNLYAWETMVASSAWELSAEADGGPRAIVFEPPGRIGSRRTLPEFNMVYGCQLPVENPANFLDVIIGFLRGAARSTDKDWGISIYGSVDRADAPWWLTHAYDLGAKYFFFWDNYQSACVPYDECLALARHIRQHAQERPDRNYSRLVRAAEVAVLLPPGYDLGHVHTGRGDMWGLGELNLERKNQFGIPYRQVMTNFFTEIERCLRSGVAFDLMWDLEGMKLDGYREIVHVREDGQVEISTPGQKNVLNGPREPARPEGNPPELDVNMVLYLLGGGDQKHDFTAQARVT